MNNCLPFYYRKGKLIAHSLIGVKALALGAPVIQVKNGKATVSIQVQQASELDGEWEVVEDGEVSVDVVPKAGEKAAFYKFVVDGLSAADEIDK